MIQIKDNPFQINFSESKLNHFDKENYFRNMTESQIVHSRINGFYKLQNEKNQIAWFASY